MSNPYQINEIQLSYKHQTQYRDIATVQNSERAYTLLHNLWDQNRIELVEDFKMLLLNRACKVIGFYNVASGGTGGVIADPKLIFVAALKTNAASIILAHNHPSGNLAPSEQDKSFTKRLTDAGQLLDVKLQDHIIVTNDGYYSFADQLAYNKMTLRDKVYFEALQPF